MYCSLSLCKIIKGPRRGHLLETPVQPYSYCIIGVIVVVIAAINDF